MSSGTLSEVNEVAKREDAKISAALRAGGAAGAPAAAAAVTQGVALPLHGLVAISCDIHDVNRCGFWNITALLSRSPPHAPGR